MPKQNVETLTDVREYVAVLLEHRQQSVTTADLQGVESVEESADTDSTRRTLAKERVKCGADYTCTDGTGHGAYLYRYFREDDKCNSEYVGKP